MAKQTDKASEGKATNPRGAENANPFDKYEKAMEVKDNQKPDESAEQGKTLATSNVQEPEAGSTNKEAGSTNKANESPFVAFNLDTYQLGELYSNVRDGNYWSAFRIAVEILHTNMSFDTKAVRGTPTQRMAARAMQQPVNKVQVEELKSKLEEACADLEKQQGQQVKVTNKPTAVGASQEKNVGKVDLAGLLALVRMILQLFHNS